jgi:hypothetical protein
MGDTSAANKIFKTDFSLIQFGRNILPASPNAIYHATDNYPTHFFIFTLFLSFRLTRYFNHLYLNFQSPDRAFSLWDSLLSN